MLKKNYSKDTFDLEELDGHNGIEHDASLLREWLSLFPSSYILNDLPSGLDAALQPDQSVKHIPYIEELLATPTVKDKHGNDIITAKDISRILGKRRAVARAVNKEYSLSLFHRIFGSAKYIIFIHLFKHTLTFHQCLDTNHHLWRSCG
jgi:hypothetical protein